VCHYGYRSALTPLDSAGASRQAFTVAVRKIQTLYALQEVLMETAAAKTEKTPVKKSGRFRAFLNSSWTQAVGTTILGIVLSWIGMKVHVYINLRPLHAIWDNIIAGQTEIPIVIGNTRVTEFMSINTKSPSRLPANAPLLGEQEAVAISNLREVLGAAYSDKNASVHEFQNFPTMETHESFISVGGASINDITGDMLRHKLDAKLRIVYPDHYALDGNKRYDTALSNGQVVKDYGFIVVGPNPYDSSKTVCLAFGIWPQGTSAALSALTNPVTDTDEGRQFLERVKNRQGVVAIVSVEVNQLSQGRPHFEVVRPLAH
jgi:hypothetical protein